MEMLAKFPHLILQPTSDKHTIEYDGFISICDEEFHIHVISPRYGSIKTAKISCDSKLQHYLQDYKDILHQRLSRASNLQTFLTEIQNIVERRIQENKTNKPSTSTSSLCSDVVSELDQIGWDRLQSIDDSFQCIELTYEDSGGRNHNLVIKLSDQHPKQTPTFIADLPSKFEPFWNISSSMKSVYDQFKKIVEAYQDFFDQMSNIDKNTWVLEPEKPTYSAVFRRIAISSNSSIQITVNPSQPYLLPECRFIGADHAIDPLREHLNSNLQKWSLKKALLDNLMCVLEVTFPSPETSTKEEFNAECGICYAYRLGSEIPEEACNDSRCGQSFHRTCLYEWLRALPSTRQSFNTVFGECPYCCKAVTVKMPVQ